MCDLLLAIDIGNTHTTLGVFDGARLVGQRSAANAPLPGLAPRLSQALDQLAAQEPPHAAAASVHPEAWGIVCQWAEARLGTPVRRVRRDIVVDMPLRIQHPETLGDDRLMNAVAAYHRAQGAAIVADFGTATTFEVVSATGEYLGGAIAPGLRLSARALNQGAAQLPYVEPVPVGSPLGRHTEESMVAGCFYAQVGLAKEVIERLRLELGSKPRVYATGGDATAIAPYVPAIDEVVPELTLEGIARTYHSGR